MLGLLFVALLQATDPSAAPAPAQVEAANPDAAASEAAAQEETAQAEAASASRRRCQTDAVTGSRLRTVVRCESSDRQQDAETRRALQQVQRPGGTNVQ